MNQRIKELAEQAGDDWDSTLQSDKEFLKKFAELIVRECAKRSGELGQPEIGQGIMKHFGVNNE